MDQSDKVLVVPNSASTGAGIYGYPGKPSQISFVNLPYKCKLKIFTKSGDFIYAINHFGTDQEIWFQKTDNNQYVVSGIYSLAVNEAKTLDGKSLPDQFVKFILVR